MRLPKERRAVARASSSLSPCSWRRSISSCRCAWISEVKSLALRLLRNMALAFRALRSQNPRDGAGQSLPFVGFFDQLFAAGGGQRVEAGLAVIGRNAPLGGDPTALFQALECGVESAMFDEQLFLRCLLDGACDALAVLRTED